MSNSDRDYTLSVSEEQLRIIEKSLESFFRTRYCQFIDLVDDLAFAGYEWGKEGREEVPDFDERIRRRNKAQEMFDAAGREARPYFMRTQKTHDCMVAEDVWAVIRHELYKEKHGNKENVMDVRSYAPMLISGEKPVILNRNDKE